MTSIGRALSGEVTAFVSAIVGALPGLTGSAMRAWFCRFQGMKLGSGVWLGSGLAVVGPGNVRIGTGFGCGRYCLIVADDGGRIVLGNRVKLNERVHLNASIFGQIDIGDDVLMGPGVVLRARHRPQ
jgi:acetyltransferase-like isoleucine patch superfamily enzyme